MASTRPNAAPTHFFYVDYLLLFCRVSTKNLQVIMSAFAHFEAFSRQVVKWEKSFLFIFFFWGLLCLWLENIFYNFIQV